MCVQLNQRLCAEVDAGAENTFYLCTDGQLHIRQVLHPEASSKVLKLLILQLSGRNL